MNKILSKSNLSAFLVFSILFISLTGMISASVNVNDYVTTSVTVGQHNTAVQFSLVNPSTQGYDNQNIAFSVSGGKLIVQDNNMPVLLNDLLSSYLPEGTSGTLSFKVSDILNGINFQANFADGATSPTFSNVNIDGNTPITISISIPGVMSLPETEMNFNLLLNLVHSFNSNSPLLADLNNPAFRKLSKPFPSSNSRKCFFN